MRLPILPLPGPLGRLEKGSIVMGIVLGLNTLWDAHTARKRAKRDDGEKDRRIRELEDRVRALEQPEHGSL
jgi:hypothetical protein